MEFKRTWTKCTDDRIIKIFNDVMAEARRLYPQQFELCEPELYFDTSRKHLGRCVSDCNFKSMPTYEFRAFRCAGKIRHTKCVILLSKYMASMTDSDITNTLVHEMGHFVSPMENHNYLWKTRANNIGKAFNTRCDRLAGHDESQAFHQSAVDGGAKFLEYKYFIECPKCHTVWKRKVMSDFVKNCGLYTCGKCNVKLQRKY